MDDVESIRILLIEDDRDDAWLVRHHFAQLASPRIDVVVCDRLQAAIERLGAQCFDAVLLDLNLPGSAGLETIRQLHTSCPHVPVVVLTGSGCDELSLEAVKAGADDYLLKTQLDGQRLLHSVRYAIERARHREADALLQDEQARYRILFDEAPIGLVIVDPQTGRAVEFNDAACQQLDYSREEFAALRIADYEARESPEAVERHVREVLRQGRASFETRHRSRSGELRDVWVTVRTIELGGRPLLYCIFRDVTDRKAGEQLARESERRYRELLGAVTNYTYSVHLKEGTPLTTEHSLGCLTTTGYGPDDYAANPYLWITMVHPEDREMVRTYVERIFAAEEVPPIEHRIFHRDGSVRWIRDTIVRHYNGHALIRYDGLVEDITERKAAEQRLREREAELMAVFEIQTGLLPKGPPALPGCDVSGAWYPAAFAAGDYYDYFSLPDGSTLLVIGDVSGHGLAPAMLMVLTYAHLRSLIQSSSDVSRILEEVNRFLAGETERFVTMLVVRIDPCSRSLIHVNAGHTPGYVVDAAGEVKAVLSSTGIPLAVLPDASFPPGLPVALAPGDVILMLTDGVTEARSPAGQQFGCDRALDVIRAHRRQSASDIIAALYCKVREFSCREEPEDDITVMVIKVGAECPSGNGEPGRRDDEPAKLLAANR